MPLPECLNDKSDVSFIGDTSVTILRETCLVSIFHRLIAPDINKKEVDTLFGEGAYDTLLNNGEKLGEYKTDIGCTIVLQF